MSRAADNKRLAPPRPAAAPEKPGANVSEQFEFGVVSKDAELARSRCAGFASLETLDAIGLLRVTIRGNVMPLEIRQVLPKDVEALRDLYRARASCQLVHDSAVPRGLADAYLLIRSGEAVGYGAVWKQYYPGRVVEFFLVPEMQSLVEQFFPRFMELTDATHIEAQTNVPDMLRLLRRWGVNTVEEKTLFADKVRTRLTCSAATFRRCNSEGEWLLELNGEVVARGGALSHYNPPYWDLYMEVSENHRRRGFGSYMVQELKKICYEEGKVPGARCDPDNLGSRRTLEKAGMRVCGSLLAAELMRNGAA